MRPFVEEEQPSWLTAHDADDGKSESPSLPPRSNSLEASSVTPLTLRPIHPYPYPTPDPAIHGEGPFVAALPAKDRAPPDLRLCPEQLPMWHPDCLKVGQLYETDSVFLKQRKGGSISLIYEQQLRQRGIHGYAFTVLEGSISAADGVGFVFAGRVPCSKNIKRLWSVFVNRTGKISKRMGDVLIRADTPELPPFALGHVLSMVVDLNLYRATFEVRADYAVLGRSHVDLADMAERVDASSGYFCAAVARAGMVVRLTTAPAALLSLPEVKPTLTIFDPFRPLPFKKPFSRQKHPPWDSRTDQVYPSTYGGDVEGLVPNFPQHQEHYRWSSVVSSTPVLDAVDGHYVDPLPLFRSGKTAGASAGRLTSLDDAPDASGFCGSDTLTLGKGMDDASNNERVSSNSEYRDFLKPPSLLGTSQEAILKGTRSEVDQHHWTAFPWQDTAASLDPMLLLDSNRGLSTSSNSSAFVGTRPDTILSPTDAVALLKKLNNWSPCQDAPAAASSTEQPTRMKSDKDDADEDEDESGDIVGAMPFTAHLPEEPNSLHGGNRTVSAPPAPGGMFT